MNLCNNELKPKSASPRNIAIKREKIITTLTYLIASFLVGQVMRSNSDFIEEKKECKDFIYFNKIKYKRLYVKIFN